MKKILAILSLLTLVLLDQACAIANNSFSQVVDHLIYQETPLAARKTHMGKRRVCHIRTIRRQCNDQLGLSLAEDVTYTLLGFNNINSDTRLDLSAFLITGFVLTAGDYRFPYDAVTYGATTSIYGCDLVPTAGATPPPDGSGCGRPVPDAGSTVMLLGMAVSAIGAIRSKLT